MSKNVVEDRIDSINRILDQLNDIEKRLDQINATLFNGGFSAEEFVQMVTERSNLFLKRNQLENLAKDYYKLKIKGHGNIEVNGLIESV